MQATCTFLGHHGMEQNTDHLFETLQNLVEGWCDRRCLRALRAILRGYPLTSPSTDGWAELLTALQDVRSFAGSELTDAEVQAAQSVCFLPPFTAQFGRLR